MKKVLTKEDLVIHLASGGDPMAFHSLFGDRIRNEYARLCTTGAAGKDTADRILHEAASVFRQFIGEVPESLDEWYATHAQSGAPASDPGATEITFERTMQADLDLFDRKLQIVLQRQASRLRSRKGNRAQKAPGSLKSSRRAVIAASCIGSIVAAAAFFSIYLNLTDSTLTVTLAGSKKILSISIPGGIDTATTPAAHIVAIPDSIMIQNIIDSLRIADSLAARSFKEASPAPPSHATAARKVAPSRAPSSYPRSPQTQGITAPKPPAVRPPPASVSVPPQTDNTHPEYQPMPEPTQSLPVEQKPDQSDIGTDR